MSEQNKLLREIQLLKQSLLNIEANNSPINGWLTKKLVKRFLDYGDTQLRNLEKKKLLVVSKVGHRKFYSYESVQALIKSNIINKK